VLFIVLNPSNPFETNLLIFAKPLEGKKKKENENEIKNRIAENLFV